MVSLSPVLLQLLCCLDDKSRVLNSPTIRVWRSVCDLSWSHFFYEAGCPCVWCIHIQNYNTLSGFLSWICSSIPISISFGLKSILSIKMATPVCFSGLFVWNIFFQAFALRWCLSLMLQCVSCLQHKDGPCFHILNILRVFLLGEMRPLMLKDISEQGLFIPLSLLFCFCDLWMVCVV